MECALCDRSIDESTDSKEHQFSMQSEAAEKGHSQSSATTCPTAQAMNHGAGSANLEGLVVKTAETASPFRKG